MVSRKRYPIQCIFMVPRKTAKVKVEKDKKKHGEQFNEQPVITLNLREKSKSVSLKV